MNKLLLLLFSMAFAGFWAVDVRGEEEENGTDNRPMIYVDAKAIDNKSDNKNANFSGLVNRLNNGLTECGIYRVLDSAALGEGLKDDEVFKVAADDGGKESKVETPAMKVYMTVMQYGYAKKLERDMYGNAKAIYQAKIELILKVVDMRTKETLKSKNISRSATGTATTEANLVEQVLQEASKLVVNDIIDVLVSLTSFEVLDAEGNEVVIDAPGNRFSQGQELQVFKKGRAVKSKRTGKSTARESLVATVVVSTLGEDSVTCILKSGAITPDENAEEGSEFAKYIIRIPEKNAQIKAIPVQAPVPAAPVNKNIAPF